MLWASVMDLSVKLNFSRGIYHQNKIKIGDKYRGQGSISYGNCGVLLPEPIRCKLFEENSSRFCLKPDET